MSDQSTVADAIVDILETVGIDACFGVPGGQTLPFYGAARARGFRHVMMRDERNCACAADAYARVSGKVGVCDATVGPGVTNLVSGLAEALASSVPVIALIADIHTNHDHLRRRSIAGQAFEQRPLMETVSKWVGRVQTPEQLTDTMVQALRIATTGRPGPVVIEIPQEIWLAPAASFDLSRFTADCARWPRHRSAAPTSAIDKAVAYLTEAERPVVLAGGGAMASGAYEEVTAFAEEFNIPVVTSVNAKGIIDEQHPLSFGAVGVFGNVTASHVLQQADVVVTLGSKYSQLNSFSWQLPHKAQRVLQVDVDGEELGRSITAQLEIVADIKETAQQLLTALRRGDRTTFAWQVQGRAPEQPGTQDSDPAVAPEAVITTLNEFATENTILVSDASLSSGWCASRYKVRGAGRKFIAPRGLAGIGWGCGAAIGVALAAPKGTRTVLVAGDGSAAYWLGEIETAVRLNLPITFVILNNASFGWIVQVERAMGIEKESTFAPVDFAAIGKGIGAGGSRAHSIEEVNTGLRNALDHPGPFVLEVLSSDQSTPTVDYECVSSEAASSSSPYGT